jgi:hypothetical protein
MWLSIFLYQGRLPLKQGISRQDFACQLKCFGKATLEVVHEE